MFSHRLFSSSVVNSSNRYGETLASTALCACTSAFPTWNRTSDYNHARTHARMHGSLKRFAEERNDPSGTIDFYSQAFMNFCFVSSCRVRTLRMTSVKCLFLRIVFNVKSVLDWCSMSWNSRSAISGMPSASSPMPVVLLALGIWLPSGKKSTD